MIWTLLQYAGALACGILVGLLYAWAAVKTGGWPW